MAGRQFVVRALADEQRPQPPDARAVERCPVGVLTIAIVVVALGGQLKTGH
jgi:hypothetical protein